MLFPAASYRAEPDADGDAGAIAAGDPIKVRRGENASEPPLSLYKSSGGDSQPHVGLSEARVCPEAKEANGRDGVLATGVGYDVVTTIVARQVGHELPLRGGREGAMMIASLLFVGAQVMMEEGRKRKRKRKYSDNGRAET